MTALFPALLLLFQSGAFSHKAHLAQKIACTDCHAAAVASTRAEDNLLPSASVCARCHEDHQPRQAPTPHFVARFNHAAHSKMLNCGNCHAMKADALNPGFPSMQFCIGCHNKIDLPDSCLNCHLKSQELRPASHLSANFFDTHSSGKMNTKNGGCAVCHGKFFTCQGCH